MSSYQEEKTSSHKPGSANKVWSNTRCIEIAFSDSFPTFVKDIAKQKRIIENFLNFYLGKRIKKRVNIKDSKEIGHEKSDRVSISAADIIFATISIMPLHPNTEEFIFKQEHYNDQGAMFFLTSEDRLKAEHTVIMTKNANESTAAEVNDHKECNNIEVDDSAFIDPVKITTQHYSNDVHVYNEEDKYKPTNNIDQSKENKSIDPIKEMKFASNSEQKDEVQTEERPLPETVDPNTGSESSSAAPTFPRDVVWYSNKPRAPIREDKQLVYGPLENSAFTESCEKSLKKWDSSPPTRIALKYFFGIVALTLLRGATKSYKHLVNTFSSNKFLNTVIFSSPYLKYSVPHKTCIKTSSRYFGKIDKNISIMFAKIVVNSFYIDSLRKSTIETLENKITLNIFKLTVLAHTADYGLGLVSMMQTLAKKLGNDDLDLVIKITYCEKTAESWTRLGRFLDSYMTESSKETTHHWARLIDGECFNDLNCANNYSLAMILAVFVENITKDTGIWRSSWVGKQDHFEALKDLGLKMYKEFDIELQRKKW